MGELLPTLTDLYNMPMNSQLRIPEHNSDFSWIFILRVPGGWIYTFHDAETIIKSSNFVPEPPKEEIREVPADYIGQSSSNTLEEFPVSKEIDCEEFFKDHMGNFHKYWVISYANKYGNRNAKHFKFNDQKHLNNWERQWVNEYGNKIFGYEPCDENGDVIVNFKMNKNNG